MIRSFFHLNEKKYLECSQAKVAYRYYLNHRENLITGEREAYSIQDFIHELDHISLQSHHKECFVWHLYYEFGFYLLGMKEYLNEKIPLGIKIEYAETKEIKKRREESIDLEMIMKPEFSEYKKIFKNIYGSLERGDCYQLNLTFPYEFILKKRQYEIDRIFMGQPDLSPFAHTSFLGDEFILSNSPECLFQLTKKNLYSFPIKGTRKKSKDAWKEILNSSKERGELYMISDLILNDLNMISLEAQIVKKRARLKVPGLVHQCSILKLPLEQDYSLGRVVRALFPGGSITGAPKKRVMKLIYENENRLRGFYCGSTILKHGPKCVASINIRTAHFPLDTEVLNYQAGGGITLLSEAHKEYLEMESKMKSFLTLLSRSSKVL